MKKIVLSLAGVLAATAFAPEASALPAFARQVGMACNACHQQHFPVLNTFGRAFKASGYTMMGAQAKVEGEHLSIPATLNAAILMKVRYYKDQRVAGVADTTTFANNTGNGQLQFGDEFSLFFGGRVAENVGFIFEGNTVATGGQLLAGIRLPFVFDMGSAKMSVIPFSTDALGVQYGYELSSGGVMRANRWNENRRETSAIQYNADRGTDAGQASGVAFVAQNDMGFINLTRWTPTHIPASNGQAPGNNASTEMKSTYLRVAATPTVGDWAMVLGAGGMSGASASAAGAVVTRIDTRQTFVDFQAHGLAGGKELGVYFQHANAPSVGVGSLSVNNAYNTGINTRKATTIGVDYSVLPHVLSLAASYRSARNGGAIGADGDNAFLVGAVYDFAQNIAFHANYMSYSGSAYNANPRSKNQYMGMLEMSW